MTTTETPDTKDWAEWARNKVQESVKATLKDHVVASRKNGSTIVSYVGVGTGNKDRHQFFSGTQLFSTPYEVTEITPTDAYNMQTFDAEKWAIVEAHELSPHDYVTLVTRLEGVVKIVQGLIVKANENVISFLGEEYNESFGVHLNPEVHTLYKSRLQSTRV